MRRNTHRILLTLQSQLVLLLLATAVSGQSAPTPEQLDFATVLGGRIRSSAEAEVATLKTQQLNPALTAMQSTERTRNTLVEQVAQVTGRIEVLTVIERDFPHIRGNMDPAGVQLRAGYQGRLVQYRQQLDTLRTQLTASNTALGGARQRWLEAERAVALKQAANTQLFDDLSYLLRMWQQSPIRCSGEAVRDRLIEVAREKQLRSRVTISTGSVPVNVRYQLASGGPISSANNCTQCVIGLLVGTYNFWVDKGGSATPQMKKSLIFRENQTVNLSQP